MTDAPDIPGPSGTVPPAGGVRAAGLPLGPDDPSSVGPYTVLGLLGRGGMGRVYLACDPQDADDPRGPRVAVKVIRPELASDDRFRARFRREIDAARSVPARYTAQVLAADPDAPRPWVATRYVPGPSLEAYVRDHGPLERRALRRLAIGLFRALVALGDAGLVHRDLKPSNVLLDGGRPGRVRVVDFGIARAADDTRMTSTGALVGTPAYMAPEQAIGDTEIGAAADVHAVGAMLVFAATASSPYATTSPAAVLYRKLHGSPDLGSTPAPERGWAARCLERDPADRPAAARLLSEARRPVRVAVTTVVAVVALAVAAVAAVLLLGGTPRTTQPTTPSTASSAPPSNGAPPGPAVDAALPGGGPAATAPPPSPATVEGTVARPGHRSGRVAAGVGRVYVTDADSGAVTVLDQGGQTVGRIDAGRFPSALALSPDGSRLYLTLSTTPTRLAAVDTSTLQVTGTVDLASGAQGSGIVLPADLAVTPDGGTVVVSEPRSSRVVAVDAATLRPAAERSLDAVPRTLAVTPDGARVLVASGTPGDDTGVAVLGLPGLAPLATAPGVDDALALAAVGDLAYLSSSGQSVAATPPEPGLRVLDGADGRVRSILDDVGSATRLVAGPGGRWLYALDGSEGDVAVVDTTGQRVVERLTLPDGGAAGVEDIAVSPDGRALVVASGDTVRTFTAPGG